MKKYIIVLLVICFLGLTLFTRKSDLPTVEPTPPPPITVEPPPKIDQRIAKLTKFFDHYKCPQVNYDLIPKYLQVADKFSLPFGLLPAISIQESSCARYYRFNNIYGWNSARTGFDSFEGGLEFVADKLFEGSYYKGRTLKQKLNAYNPNPDYYYKIIKLMKELE